MGNQVPFLTSVEHDGTGGVDTKKVLVYGWDGSTKRRLAVDSSGNLNTATTAPSSSTFRNTALSNIAVAVKASSGSLYGYAVENTNTANVYLQFYDVAQASVVVGTTVPKLSLPVPAGGILDSLSLPAPVPFGTAITVAATTTATGGTAPSSALLVNLVYS